MSIRKQSPYGPFVKRVMLPAFRVGLLLAASLAIGFGSWLETNDSLGGCAFKSSMSFHQVYLYRNISSNLTTPDSVSFGLWKSCYFYALNCSCTLTNLYYEPDIGHILQVATENHATPPLATTTSYTRFIPLILSTTIIGISFFLGLWANRRNQFVCRRIVCGFMLVSTVLVTYVFGRTYNSYFNSIKQTCKDPNNTIYCARHAVGIEVIVFTITIALLLISFVFWCFVSAFFKPEQQEEWPEADIGGDRYYWWHFIFKRTKPEIVQEQEQTKEEQLWFEKDLENTNSPVPMLQQYHRQQLQQKKQYTNNNNYSSQNPRVTKPNLIFDTPSSQGVVSPCVDIDTRRSPAKKQYNKLLCLQSLAYKQNKKHSPYKSPSSASPFQFSNTSHDSVMMMKHSPNGATDMNYLQEYKVPILKAPPLHHPLNRKKITDKRIQSYLQQKSDSSTSS